MPLAIQFKMFNMPRWRSQDQQSKRTNGRLVSKCVQVVANFTLYTN